MPSSPLLAWTELDELDQIGRIGAVNGTGGLIIQSRGTFGLATIVARRDRHEQLAIAVREIYGVELPLTPRFVSGSIADFIGTASGRWLAVSSLRKHEALSDTLARNLAGLASICDQSDGHTMIRLSGQRSREVLAKGLPLDLHPRAFAPGDAATTMVYHMRVQIWQVDNEPTYDLAISRSLAGSFQRWLLDSAAESGC